MSAIEQLKRTGFICISPSKARGRWCCCVTAFPILVFVAPSTESSRGRRIPRRCARYARLRPNRSTGRNRKIHAASSGRRHGGLARRARRRTAAIAGHDWGAPVAWHAALLRPDRFRGVIGLSVPFRPRASVAPTTVMPQPDDAVFYQLYFQTPGVAEAELEREYARRSPRFCMRPRATRRARRERPARVRDGASQRRLSDPQQVPDMLPAWLTEADLEFYVGESPARVFAAV